MNVIDIANRMQESGKFASASPDFACNGAEISFDPEVGKQWNLYNAQYEGFDINVSPAWNYATGKGVKIAIVDNGVDIWHKDLVANVDTALCYDAAEGKKGNKVYPYKVKGKTADSLSHATHCAGIAAAVRNNGIGVAGVAPDATIMSICCQDYDAIQLARGINWAWMNGADIISCSWGCAESSSVRDALYNALKYGRNGNGCVIVKSAGNMGRTDGRITWPGTLFKDSIIIVAAMDYEGKNTEYSSFGDALLVAAPGDSVLSTMVNDSIGKMSGTSMAAPHVAGVAALILERNSKLTAEQVGIVIARNARKVGKNFRKDDEDFSYEDVNKKYGLWNDFWGYGLVDAYGAVLFTPVY